MKNISNTNTLEELSQNYLKELLHYDEATGVFTWLERPLDMFKPGKWQLRACKTWNTRFANKEAGNIWTEKKSKTSYLRIHITLSGKKKLYRAHRLAILYTDGHLPSESVDHIDGNGMNNARINLREVSHGENQKNRPMNSNNTSGTVGVCWSKASQKWNARINVEGERICGGYFTNLEDAIEKREKMEIEHGYHINHGRE